MAKNVCDKHLKEEHIQLTAIIKGLHNHLRREYKANSEEFDEVWKKHTQNHSSLQLYADAMHCLATKHWTILPETRIDWCRQAAIDFFFQNGLLVALQKDEKRHFHELLRAKERDNTSEQFPQISSATTVPTTKSLSVDCSRGTLIVNVCDDAPIAGEIQNEEVITLPLTSRIRLLDVGSCYNPFLSFDEFDVLSIDLSPAKQTVLQCDFLELSTTIQSPPFNPLTFDLNILSSPLQELPCSSFHVVVFSLLLEYLPSASQRWQCCTKAHSLLAVNGLLLIVTPDSHSQHRNAPMMKCWKQAIESLGFQRWKYEKKDHIHCMAFRKVPWKPKITEVILPDGTQTASVTDMLYIPQDFSSACYNNVDTEQAKQLESSDALNDFIKLTTEELPMFDFEEN